MPRGLEHPIEKMVWATGTYSVRFNDSGNFQPRGYLTDYFTEEAVKVIEKNTDNPFFLYLAHWGVHNPVQALKSDFDKLSHIDDYFLRVYAAMIMSLDRSVQTILETLRKHNLEENTLIIFTSDNGGAGYIGLPDINKPYRGWKLNHFEGGIHVPFLMQWPAKIKPGSSALTPAHHIDIFNTIAAATQIKELPGNAGQDGMDLLAYYRDLFHQPKERTLFWKSGHQQTVLKGSWKLIRADKGSDAMWLYNLQTDPTEQTNLSLDRN